MSIDSLFKRIPFLPAVLILLSAAAVQAYNYYYLVVKPTLSMRMDLHNQILAGTAPSPYLYRVLIPYEAEAILRIGQIAVSPTAAFTAAYLLLDFLGISLLLVSLYFYLTHWFDWKTSLLGALFCAVVLGITFHDHYFQPWSFWEAGFLTLSLLLIRQDRRLLLGLLVVLASLNRETALFIPLLFLVTTQDIFGLLRLKARPDWSKLAYFAGYAGIWLVVVAGLRLALGNAEHVETLQQILRANLDPWNLRKTAVNIVLFQGAFWFFAVLGFKTAPQFIRRTAWIIPPYLALLLIWSYWVEVRLLMSLYAVLIPMALAFFAERKDQPAESKPALTE
jgi:hypothetical protein